MSAVTEFLSGLNVVDVIILAILLLSVIAGMYKGFLASGLSTVGFGASLVGASMLCPQLAALIQSNTGLMNSLEYYLDAPSMLSKLATASAAEAAVNGNLLLQARALLGRLPNALVETFENNVSGQIFGSLNLTELGQYLSQTLIVSSVYIVSFLALFAVCYILSLLVVNLLNNVFHFPLLRHFDWLLGGVFGFARGAVLVMLILAVVPMALTLIEIDAVTTLVDASRLATFFQNDFVITKIIAGAFQTVS